MEQVHFWNVINPHNFNFLEEGFHNNSKFMLWYEEKKGKQPKKSAS